MAKRPNPNNGSKNAWLLEFALGERRYVEANLATYANQMSRLNTAKSRRPEALEGREFVTSLFTAVANGKAGDVRYLICVERIA